MRSDRELAVLADRLEWAVHEARSAHRDLVDVLFATDFSAEEWRRFACIYHFRRTEDEALADEQVEELMEWAVRLGSGGYEPPPLSVSLELARDLLDLQHGYGEWA
jgi:hypothetical protein